MILGLCAEQVSTSKTILKKLCEFYLKRFLLVVPTSIMFKKWTHFPKIYLL